MGGEDVNQRENINLIIKHGTKEKKGENSITE